jgi:hypothetical protein
MPLTEERRQRAFAEALTPKEFVESMGVYQERLEEGYVATNFTGEQLATLSQPLEVLALVEETSGDVVFNLPILMKLAEQSGKLRIHILRREQNLDIAGQYLLRSGRNHLPTYIFYNSEGQELGTFIERPFFVTELMADWFKEFWEKHEDLPGYGSLPGQMPEVSRRALIEFFAEKREPYRAQEASEILEHIVRLAS